MTLLRLWNAGTRGASVAVVGAGLVFAAGCGKSNGGTSSSSTGAATTAGISSTGGSSTNGAISGTTTGAGVNTTTGSTSSGTTGEATTTGGAAGGSSTSGSGTTTTGTTSGTTSTGGTTGYVTGPPYMGFDAGPIAEPPVAAGCSAATPFANPTQGGYPLCVQCRRNSDCPSGLLCNTNVDATNVYKSYQCVACRNSTDCTGGAICQFGCTYIGKSPYYVCDNACQPDCRDAGADFCNPGLCDTDAGGCLTSWCASNSNCTVDGLGACDFTQAVVYPPNGIGTCAVCTQDAGGCGPDEVCGRSNQTGRPICQLSCLVDAGVCSGGTYCTDAGTCTSGCLTSADCAGSHTGYSGGLICHQGQCVGCLKNADCPDYNPGCNPQYSGGVAICGYCTSDQDCQSGSSSTHCELNRQSPGYYTNQCGCHSDNECPLDAPICIGLDAGAGFPQGSGRCGCTGPSDCGTFLVCEMRHPFNFTLYGSGQSYTGGACIPSCSAVPGTDCATAGIGPIPNNYYPNGAPPAAYACNPTTGYCVPCSGDSDCYVTTNGPAVAPACVPFANGTDPTSGEPTGGGRCGCSDTSQCNDNYACWNPGLSGTCQPPCTITNGQDSCNPYRKYTDYPPPADPFCNSWTGACVQCLDNYGCTNVNAQYINGLYVYGSLPTPICSPGGQCVGCVTDADCPANAPNCTDGFCGYCRTNADCFGDAGFACFNLVNDPQYYASQCFLTCVPDSNDYPTDAGNACPAGLPYCGTLVFYTNYPNYITDAFCTACRQDGQPPNYHYYYDCNNNRPPNAYYGYCQQNGTCQYYYN
jgi:Cys-rich repeat protein